MSQIDSVRKSISSITRILSGRGIKVTQRGTGAFVEYSHDGVPVLVNIPSLPDNANQDLINAIHGFLDHEVGHLIFTDFVAAAIEKPSMTDFTYNLYNIIEDIRIEKKMCDRFKGSEWNLDNVSRFVIEKSIQPALEKSENPVSVLVVSMFRAWGSNKVHSEYMADKWVLVGEFVEKIGELAKEVGKQETTLDSCDFARKIAKALNAKEKKDEPKETPPKSPNSEAKAATNIDEGKTDAKKEGESESESGEGDEPDVEKVEDEEEDDPETNDFGESLKDAIEDESEGDDESEGGGSGEEDDDLDGEEGDGEPEDGDDDSEGGEEEDDLEDDLDGEESEEGDGDSDEGIANEVSELGDVESNLEFEINDFDESLKKALKDVTIRSLIDAASSEEYTVLTRDNDKIEIYKPSKTLNPEILESMEAASKTTVGALQKSMERLIAAKEMKRNVPGRRSGKINSNALFRLKTGDTRVFKTREETKTDRVAISLLIDCSGSMSWDNKILIACQSSIAMGSVLTRLNIPFEVLGFTTVGSSDAYSSARESTIEIYEQADGQVQQEMDDAGIRSFYSRTESLYIPIFKQFDEKFGYLQRSRIAGFSQKGKLLKNNVDGESLMIAAERLSKRPEPGKFLIVLSDGEPCARGNDSSLKRNLRDSIQTIEKSGTKIIGIGIKSYAVEDYYKNYAIVNDVNELPTVLMSELKHLLNV